MLRRQIAGLAALLLLTACGPAKLDPKVIAANAATGQAYLASNAKTPGVITLRSGLQYKIIRSGPADGPSPLPGDEVKVNYEGKLLSGKVFDSSYARGVPAAMPLDGLIPGWVEALQLMRPGDEWVLYIPPEQAYGSTGTGGGEIPPESTLIFRIELLGILPGPGHSAQG